MRLKLVDYYSLRISFKAHLTINDESYKAGSGSFFSVLRIKNNLMFSSYTCLGKVVLSPITLWG